MLANNVWLRAAPGSVVFKAASGIDTGVLGNPNSAGTTHLRNVRVTGIIFDGNAVNQPGQEAKTVVSLDPIDGGTFEDCVFRNGRGYGVGMQNCGRPLRR